MNEISRDRVDDFFTEQGTKTNSWMTIKNRYNVLQAIFNFAIDRGHIKDNPVIRKKSQKPYKKTKEKKLIVTDKEFQKIYENADKHLKPQLICYWNTGMRRSEVLRLQLKDVNLEKRIITVKAEDAKSSKYRDIPINDELFPVLKEQMKGKSSNDYVFTYYGRQI